MADESTALGAQGSSGEAEPEEASAVASETDVDEVQVSWWRSKVDGVGARVEQFDESAAGRFWNQLSAADFMNSSFAFAALAVLSAFPFLAVTSAAVGGDIRSAIVARMAWTSRRPEPSTP